MSGAREITQIENAQQIFKVVNDGAAKYKGAIPDDCWHEPYMPIDVVRRELARMRMFAYRENGETLGVVGRERIKDTTLIRHLYVLTAAQGRGIGSTLLDYVQKGVATEYLLVGTWQAATWAIAFYAKHGFQLAPNKDELLEMYWNISDRQRETSCVLKKKMHRL